MWLFSAIIPLDSSAKIFRERLPGRHSGIRIETCRVISLFQQEISLIAF
jgi:hypothetical protein